MSFAENLKRIRKECHLSQEELAEWLGVSRQAVSKWEQGMGYPEVETLLLLSSKLDLSLDALMGTEPSVGTGPAVADIMNEIIITSPNEYVVAACYKVVTSGKMRGGSRAPQYALFGVSRGGTSFWGGPTTFLGWYTDQETLSKEVAEIQRAIAGGCPSYTLQYSVKTECRWGRVKITEEF